MGHSAGVGRHFDHSLSRLNHRSSSWGGLGRIFRRGSESTRFDSCFLSFAQRDSPVSATVGLHKLELALVTFTNRIGEWVSSVVPCRQKIYELQYQGGNGRLLASVARCCPEDLVRRYYSAALVSLHFDYEIRVGF